MDLPELIRLSLREDIGEGDVTTDSTVPASARGAALIRAKEALVVSGQAAAAEVFRQLGATCTPLLPDGEEAWVGAEVARVEGPLRALLTGERVALNILMRMSGIATHTRAMVRRAGGLRLVDTRKTTPLWRALERKAVRDGGAANHRFALYDGVLIKDNHIAAAGGVTAAVRSARARVHHLFRVEVEVETLIQAEEAVEAGADALLLDNMSDEEMAEVIERFRGRVLFEASGNLDGDRLPRLSGLGLDLASMGGLIHQARWVDLSMRLEA